MCWSVTALHRRPRRPRRVDLVRQNSYPCIRRYGDVPAWAHSLNHATRAPSRTDPAPGRALKRCSHCRSPTSPGPYPAAGTKAVARFGSPTQTARGLRAPRSSPRDSCGVGKAVRTGGPCRPNDQGEGTNLREPAPLLTCQHLTRRMCWRLGLRQFQQALDGPLTRAFEDRVNMSDCVPPAGCILKLCKIGTAVDRR